MYREIRKRDTLKITLASKQFTCQTPASLHLVFKECALLCILEYFYKLSKPKITIQNREKNFKAKEKVKNFSLILKAWKRTFSFAINFHSTCVFTS